MDRGGTSSTCLRKKKGIMALDGRRRNLPTATRTKKNHLPGFWASLGAQHNAQTLHWDEMYFCMKNSGVGALVRAASGHHCTLC